MFHLSNTSRCILVWLVKIKIKIIGRWRFIAKTKHFYELSTAQQILALLDVQFEEDKKWNWLKGLF